MKPSMNGLPKKIDGAVLYKVNAEITYSLCLTKFVKINFSSAINSMKAASAPIPMRAPTMLAEMPACPWANAESFSWT